MIYIQLFFSFFKIGLFSFGGGYAMLSLLQQEVVKNSWMTVDTFADMIAISQMTPGPIAINMATFVGYNTGSIFGSFMATLGVVMPSWIIVLILARFFLHFSESKFVQSIFYGLRPAVIGLISVAAIQVARIALWTGQGFNFKAILVTLGVIGGYKAKIHPILLIIIAGIVGVIFF
jgi:chromate transporter